MRSDIATRLKLFDLYADYTAYLDEGCFEEWVACFTENCKYRVVPRENYDGGLPLSTMDLQGVGMLRDRIYAVQSTLFHAPYYQKHIISQPRITASDESWLAAEANYLVVRTKRDEPSEVFQAGRYIDRIEIVHGRLLFSEKVCVFDSELIPNSIIYPI